jgi:Uma2 family endonuclease
MTVKAPTFLPTFFLSREEETKYPETDGKPMAETDFQRKPLMYCVEALDAHFADNPQIYVSGDLLIYYEEGNPNKSCAPDVFVVLNVPKKERGIYKMWEEGKAPDVVIEILSSSTWKKDTTDKKQLYSQLGVKEYFLFDPLEAFLDKPLMGYWLDKDGEYQPIGFDELPGGISLESLILRLELRYENGELRLYDFDAEQYLYNYDEERQARIRERQARLKERQARLEAESQLHQTVLNMLSEGLPTEMISRLTGLSVTEIERLTD